MILLLHPPAHRPQAAHCVERTSWGRLKQMLLGAGGAQPLALLVDGPEHGLVVSKCEAGELTRQGLAASARARRTRSAAGDDAQTSGFEAGQDPPLPSRSAVGSVAHESITFWAHTSPSWRAIPASPALAWRAQPAT